MVDKRWLVSLSVRFRIMMGVKDLRDNEGCAAVAESSQSLLDPVLRLCVNSTCRLIQEYNGGLLQNSARNRHAL